MVNSRGEVNAEEKRCSVRRCTVPTGWGWVKIPLIVVFPARRAAMKSSHGGWAMNDKFRFPGL
jgi:hypothetical protein